jgi:hypothetical protein
MLARARSAGIKVCSGGIVSMNDTRAQRADLRASSVMCEWKRSNEWKGLPRPELAV